MLVLYIRAAAVVFGANPVHLFQAVNGSIESDMCWTCISGLLLLSVVLTLPTPAEARTAGPPAEQQQQLQSIFEFQSSGARCSKPGCRTGRLLCMHDRQATAARTGGACEAAGCPEACRGEKGRGPSNLQAGWQTTTLLQPGRPVRSTWLAASRQFGSLRGL